MQSASYKHCHQLAVRGQTAVCADAASPCRAAPQSKGGSCEHGICRREKLPCSHVCRLYPVQRLQSRKVLIRLILALNASYPDYDFSLLRAHHFRKEDGVARAEEVIDSHLLEVSKASKD